RHHLKQVEQRLILHAEARELRDQLTAARCARDAQNSRQVESLRAENDRLQTELAEASEKLDAITNIERPIREREHGANVQSRLSRRRSTRPHPARRRRTRPVASPEYPPARRALRRRGRRECGRR